MASFKAQNMRVRLEMIPECSDDMEQRYVVDLRHATVCWDKAEDRWSHLEIEGAPGNPFPEEKLTDA